MNYLHCAPRTADGVEGLAVVRAHQVIEEDILVLGHIVEVDLQEDIVEGKNM